MDLHSDTQTQYDSEAVNDLVCENEEISFKEFSECVFTGCSFRGTSFRGCRFRDCTFKECDLSLIHVEDSSFSSTRFEDSRVTGVNWAEANWAERGLLNSIDFFDCVISYSTFIGLDMKGITITRCIAKDVDFAEADLTEANCTYTDFSDSRFLHTDLTEADFTHATNYSIDASLNVLKKTKFSLPEAMSLLHSLDIVLTE